MTSVSFEEQLQSKIEDTIQPILESSVTPIVGLVDGQLFQYGTGTYFAVADRFFLVTADHVTRVARSKQISLYVPGCEPDSATRQLLPLTEIAVSGVGRNIDIAIAELPKELLNNLQCRRFLRLNDVDFSELDADGWFYIAGIPHSLCREGNAQQPVRIEGIGYLTCLYRGNVSNLENYDPNIHLLLDYALSDTCDTTGEEAEPTDTLGGISGSSIWEVYRPGQDLQSWSPKSIKVVGVQTAVYPPKFYRNCILVRATAWSAVAKVLWLRFEELRPSLSLWLPQEWIAGNSP